MSKRILLKGEIGAGRAINDAAVKRILDQCRGEELTVVIDSPGGSVAHSISIHNQILKHDREQATVTTIALHAASGAGLIFVAGSQRMIGLNCELMIHAARGSSKDMNELAGDIMVDMYARVSNNAGEIYEHVASGDDVYYSAADCVRSGIAHIAMRTSVLEVYDHVLQ